MTVTEDKEPEIAVTAVPDKSMATAVGVQQQEAKKSDAGAGGAPSNGPPIPAGHSRF